MVKVEGSQFHDNGRQIVLSTDQGLVWCSKRFCKFEANGSNIVAHLPERLAKVQGVSN